MPQQKSPNRHTVIAFWSGAGLATVSYWAQIVLATVNNNSVAKVVKRLLDLTVGHAIEVINGFFGTSFQQTNVFAFALNAVYLATIFALVSSIRQLHLAKNHWREIPVKACAHCGYDLVGSRSGVCPECGSLAIEDA